MKEKFEEARANSYIEFAKSNLEVDMYSFVAGFNKGVEWEDEPKQEPLEEAARSTYKRLYEGEPLTQEVPIDAFKRGYRLAEKQRYSVEEVIQLVEDFKQHLVKVPVDKMLSFKEWFETFGKK